MKWALIIGCIALIGVQYPLVEANAAPRTYSYTVTHPLYGVIGTYDRTIDDTGGSTRAESRLVITVKILGFVVHRETADQTEVWRDKRLMSFHSVTTTNGKPLSVRGEALENRFMVTSPSGTMGAPADVAASDPLSLNQMGSEVVVSMKTGKISQVEVTGGEADTVTRLGISKSARHFSVSTLTQPNKWEAWFDQQGVPIKFSSLESGGRVDFTLMPPQAGDVSNQLLPVRAQLAPSTP
jgi:hypothetical protein